VQKVQKVQGKKIYDRIDRIDHLKAKRSKRSKRSEKKNNWISELKLVAADKDNKRPRGGGRLGISRIDARCRDANPS